MRTLTAAVNPKRLTRGRGRVTCLLITCAGSIASSNQYLHLVDHEYLITPPVKVEDLVRLLVKANFAIAAQRAKTRGPFPVHQMVIVSLTRDYGWDLALCSSRCEVGPRSQAFRSLG